MPINMDDNRSGIQRGFAIRPCEVQMMAMELCGAKKEPHTVRDKGCSFCTNSFLNINSDLCYKNDTL